MRITHRRRVDNICFWIKREEVEPVVDFLQSLKSYIIDPYYFYPEYRGIAITRELHTSYSELLANALFPYLRWQDDYSLNSFADWLDRDDPHEPLDKKVSFDFEILIRSLRCIQHNISPVADSPYNIVDFQRKDF